MGQELWNGSGTHLEGGAADACAQGVALATVYKYSSNGSDRQCSCLAVAGPVQRECKLFTRSPLLSTESDLGRTVSGMLGIMQMGRWWMSSHPPKHPRTLACTNGLGRRAHQIWGWSCHMISKKVT